MKTIFSNWRIFAVFLVVLVACNGGPEERDDPSIGADSEGESVENEGLMEDEGWDPVRTVEGEPLEDEEVETLLGRLPELEADDSDEVTFKRRDESMKPPLTGEDIEGEWPPDLTQVAAQASPDGSLTVQAFRPTGEVELPFQVAISFDRPVVELGAVGTQDTESFSQDGIAGTWRWIGTQTIIFEPEGEWPMSSFFYTHVEEGLEAVDGTRLEEALEFEFTTAAVEVDSVFPKYGPNAADSPVAVVFNQPIEVGTEEAVSVRHGKDEHPMQLVVADAFDSETVQEFIEKWNLKEAREEGRLLIFSPQQSYPSGATMTVDIDGPMVAAEGPIVATEQHQSTFEVRGEHLFREIRCGYQNECPPDQGLQLIFSNPLDVEASDFEVVADPAVEDLHAEAIDMGSSILVHGDFKAETTYKINIEGDVVDTYGQDLQGTRTRSIMIDNYSPLMRGPEQALLVQPTAADPEFPIRVAGLEKLRVRLYSVTTDDWDEFARIGNERDAEIGLDLVETQDLTFSESERQESRELEIDTSSAVEDGQAGHMMVVIDQPSPWEGWNDNPRLIYWVQRTDLSVDITTGFDEITALATSLADGSKLEGVEFQARGHTLGTSGSDGEATFSVPQGQAGPIIATDGGDSLIFPVNGQTNWFSGREQWTTQGMGVDLLWYVVDDRKMYKPGETVRLHGWKRILERSPRSELRGVDQGETVEYTVFEPRGNEIADGEVEVDEFGGFELEFDVPDGANLGSASIRLKSSINEIPQMNRNHSHFVEFQEFRRPEYEVNLESDEGPHQVAETTQWNAEASYYAGGAVAGMPAMWRFTETSASFQPSGWQGWSFGAWSPWWSPWGGRGGVNSQNEAQVLPEEFRNQIASTTDAQGGDQIEMTFNRPDRGLPRRVSGTVSVADVNRQSWEGTDSVLVHPADVYIGLRSEQNFVHRDEPWEVEAVVVDIDGEEVDGQSVEFDLRKRQGSEFNSVETRSEESEGSPLEANFSDLTPGSYQLLAIVEDEEGRTSETELNFWVAGRDTSGAETAEEDELMLIPNTDEFAAGDTAELFVQAPYYPLDAVVELRRDGLFERRHVQLTEDDPVVEVEIEEAMIPNVHVRVQALADGDAYEPENFAAGSINLTIDRAPRTLEVRVDPEHEVIAPGSTADFGVQVVDDSGEPVENAQVFVYAVDESVLALSSYELLDPLSVFYPARAPGRRDIRSRSWLLLETEEEPDDDVRNEGTMQIQERSVGSGRGGGGMGMGAPMADEAAPMMMAESKQAGDDAPAIDIREVFDALAFYRSDLVTDENGRVQITEEMPDSLTRYRVMAVAVEGDRRFGTGENDVTARKPLMVRPSPPRFLNVGDEFGFPVVVHNRTGETMSVDVALRATAGLEFTDGAGRRIEVPANDRVEVRLPARAISAGDTRVQVAISGGEYSDAELASFPVLTPATTEAFATYGSIGADDDDALVQAINVPTDAYTEFGGLDFSASSTQLQALTDAFIYLTSYPFECSEQLASRIMSVLALYDVLEAFDAPDLPETEELEASVDEWIARLIKMQRQDGGFGFWSGSRESSPYVSVHATHALWMAGEAGYEVPPHVIQSGQNYMSNMSSHVAGYHERAASTVEAYSLHVRNKMGQAPQRDLDSLLGRYGIEEISLEGLGWLLPMADGTQWEERFMQRITGQVQETAATAEFQETFSADAYRVLHTTRRTDGVVLDGLIQVDEDHPLIEKVARGLLAHRSRGRWGNTQENVFILMTLRRYFDTYEDVEPDFVARAWLGEDQIAEHEFEGRTTERYSMSVPMSFLHEGPATQPVVVQRDGEGRMYYRLGVRYAPKSREMPPSNQGFTVERNYEAVDDDDDVRRTDEGWEVRAGARVRVELTMTIPARRYHVALVDWLPAGFEPINTALDVSAVESDLTGGSRDGRRWGWWGQPWFEHQNLRDERVEAFSSFVSEGIHTYSYVARATTPGEFVAMPAKAEEMYHPETFGRSGTEMVRVVE